MKTPISRLVTVVATLALALPGGVRAHEGHAGDHGWLAGAAQPLLSLDHFLAGLFVFVLGALGIALLTRGANRRASATD